MLRKSETATQPVRGMPFTRFVGDLDQKEIMLVATAGIIPRLQSSSEPDRGYYRFSKDVRIEDLYLPKQHFGLEEVDADLNCLFPIDRLHELANEQFISAPTIEHISIYGFHLMKGHVRRVLAPRVAEIVESVDAGAAVILGGCLFCHRIAAVVQRAIEDRGIPTVTVSQYPRLSRYYGVSRILYPVGFRTGHVVGPPNHPELQRTVLKDALNLLNTIHEPLEIVEKEYPKYPNPGPKRKKHFAEIHKRKRGR